MDSYDIKIIGDKNVGKPTFVRRIATGEFGGSSEIKKIEFNTNFGYITFNISDDENADAIIGICDVSREETTGILMEFTEHSQKPSVACIHKIDKRMHKISKDKKTELEQKWGKCYETSAKTNTNYEMPFLYIARKLTKKEDLTFIPHPAFVPPVVSCL